MLNILNGGAHADTGVDVQEFMVAPVGAGTFAEALRQGTSVYHALKSVLRERGLATGLGDEGGFAPDVASNREALDLIAVAVERAGLKLGEDIVLALDVAAAEFHDADAGTYRFEGADKTTEQMSAYYTELIDSYPIVSIEDPLGEDDWAGWTALTESLGERVQVVGDDLFVTNVERLRRGIRERLAWVMPGEVGYTVIDEDGTALGPKAELGVPVFLPEGPTTCTGLCGARWRRPARRRLSCGPSVRPRSRVCCGPRPRRATAPRERCAVRV
jgi:hypothetical protein